MKTIALAAIAATLMWPETVTVKYFCDGIDSKVVNNSTLLWGFNSIKWEQVNNANDANLTIKLTNNLTSTTRYGEANHREIRVNSKYKLSNKELTNLIAHEIGHYLFLVHNNENSIMNDKLSLKTKTATEKDKDVAFIKLRAMSAKILGTAVDLSSS